MDAFLLYSHSNNHFSDSKTNVWHRNQILVLDFPFANNHRRRLCACTPHVPQCCRNRREDRGAIQILADQLTQFQPGETDYYYFPPPDFKTFLRSWAFNGKKLKLSTKLLDSSRSCMCVVVEVGGRLRKNDVPEKMAWKIGLCLY